MKTHCSIRAWLTAFCCLVLNLATERPAFADIKDVAHFKALMPNAPSLIRGRSVKISATIEMVSYPEESVESTALLTVDGQSFKPFYTIITPGEIKANETFTWFTVATGKSMTVRFRFILIGNTSKAGYEVVDITRDYQVKGPSHRPTRSKCICEKISAGPQMNWPWSHPEPYVRRCRPGTQSVP
jgi:hypothetical protein